MKLENKIETLSDIEHVLKRESMYLGSIKPIRHNSLFFENNKFVYKEYESVDGLLKIINEIIDNSVDESVRNDFKVGTHIGINITDTTVTITDNGMGIPIVKEKNSNEWGPILAFTHPRAGSNFNDDDRKTAGMNGIGSFICNCFSKSFKVITCDGKNKLALTCKNNLDEHNYDITPMTKKDSLGTTVKFKPDLKRFGMLIIDDLHKDLIFQRLIHLSQSYPQIQFKYNKRTIKLRNTKKYLQAFNNVFEYVENDNYLIAAIPNVEDDFRHISYVNGLNNKQGGNHIDLITSEIVSRVRNKISRKYKAVKPGDIKNKISIITIFKNFPNVKFEGQTKERVSNSFKEIKDYLGDINFDKIANKIIKIPEFYEPIIETFKIKAELKKRRELRELDKKHTTKKIRCEKYFPPTTLRKYFVICEGDSATRPVMKVLQRKEFGYFSARGVPLNAYEIPTTKIITNEEMKNIIHILGLQISKNEDVTLNYENVILAMDSDADGSHIIGLYLGFFKRFAPQLLENNKIYRLKTPIVALKSKKSSKIEEIFFTIGEFDKYIDKNNGKVPSKYDIKYYKGMGTWKDGDLTYLFKKYGQDKFVVPFNYDETSSNYINDWLSGSTVNKRKTYLKNHKLNLGDI